MMCEILILLADTNFILFKPSLIAAAAVLAARVVLGIQPYWTDEMAAITGYHYEELQPVGTMMIQLHCQHQELIKHMNSTEF